MEIDMTDRFSNLALADRYATIKAEIDALKKELEDARAAIKATGRDTIEGQLAIVTVSLSERETFDAKVAKTFLTPEQIKACTKVSLIETLRDKPRLS